MRTTTLTAATWLAALLTAGAAAAPRKPAAGAAPAAAAAQPVKRWVEFRDGTLLHVSLPDGQLRLNRLAADGTARPLDVKLSEVIDLRVSPDPALDRLARVHRLVRQLGHAEYRLRSAAQTELMTLAPPFRGVLEAAFQSEKDPEILLRLDILLDELPPAIADAYDELRRAAAADGAAAAPAATGPLQGDVGPFAFLGSAHGLRLRIDRQRVRRISADAPEPSPASAAAAAAGSGAGPATVDRIPADDEKFFPPRVTRIDFESDGDGKKLEVGQDVGRAFVAKGCTISTSIPNAIVSVNAYNVAGRSGGMSCATHQPQWEGALTVRFCLPGNDRVAAAVTHVGFWIAAVSPDGTKLEAYDAGDRLIGQVKTVAHNRDFLGLRSGVPISYIKIVPDPQIDPNYTIDDLVFDTPSGLTEAGDAELFTVALRTGERLKCDNVRSDKAAGKQSSPPAARGAGNTLLMKKLAVTGEDLTLPLAEVARVVTPAGMWRPGERGGSLWAMLSDGSVLRAAVKEGNLSPVRLPALKAAPGTDLAAVWGATAAYAEPPAGTPPPPANGSALVLLPGGVSPRTVTSLTFGQAGVESPDWKPSPAAYEATPPIWFGPVPKRPAPAGLLRLTNGEEFVLAEGAFRLESWTPQRVTVSRGDKTLELAASEVLSVALPAARE